jgi:signal transduction histidine kinase
LADHKYGDARGFDARQALGAEASGGHPHQREGAHQAGEEVTDRHQAAVRRSLSPAAWALRLSEAWDVGVIVLDSGGELDFANSRARYLLGAATDQDLDERWRQLHTVLAGELARATPGVSTPIESSVTIDTGGGGETQLRLQVHALEEDDCSGHLLLLQHAGHVVAIEASLRHASHDRGLASLYRDMAHDLKSVLNVIGLNLALLSRIAAEDRASHSQHDIAERSGAIMRRELKRLDRSIALILDRTLIDREAPERFDLGECCGRIAQLAASRAARQRVTVELTVADGPLVVVEGYPDRVQGAVLNLVVNALDAMPDGGTLAMRVWQEGQTAYVRVSDSGPGVAAAHLPHLWRLHATTKATGTGIGLYVTKTTVEAHGGTIAYHQPESGSGSVFTLTFTTPPQSP